MNNVGIITDSSAQFPTPNFTGKDLVTVLPLRIHKRNGSRNWIEKIDFQELLLSSRDGAHPKLMPPDEKELQKTAVRLGRKFDEIIIITLSGLLNPLASIANTALANIMAPGKIHIIDSQTTAVGLGLIVQAAAKAAIQGAGADQIKNIIRRLIPRLYAIFCTKSLTYLHHTGCLDIAQALVGEMLDITAILILENGRFSPVQKVRSPRNLIDTFNEFVCEINALEHIALLRSPTCYHNEAQHLRERFRARFPRSALSEHYLSVALGTILGPLSMGLVALEKIEDTPSI